MDKNLQHYPYALGLVAVSARAAEIHEETQILELCLELNPFNETNVFRQALIDYSFHVIQPLLEHHKKSSGDVAIVSKFDFAVNFAPEELDKPHCFRPLWYIAQRHETLDTEKMIDFFLKQGEDINGQFGPAGTAIHASCWRASKNPYGYHYATLLKALISRGADINAQGPYGRPLEYFWKLINPPGPDFDIVKECRISLRELIRLGAVNMKKYPDGHIPSVAEMKLWEPKWVKAQMKQIVRKRLLRPSPQLSSNLTERWAA